MAAGPGLVATKFSPSDAIVAQISLPVEMRAVPIVTLGATARFVSSAGVVTVTYSQSARTTKFIALLYVNNALGAGYGWLDALGLIYVSAEL